MSVYVIGDIHGHLQSLQKLLDRIAPGPEDVTIQLGDCVNRGPESFGVVEFWLQFDRCPRFVIAGNHEELMYEYLAENSSQVMEYGGGATIESYRRAGWRCEQGDPASVPEEHFCFYQQAFHWTRPFLVTARYLFTHAGYRLNQPPERQDATTLRWGRVTGSDAQKRIVVRGHSPRQRVVIRPKVIEVDTGCGLGGRLSCLRLDTGEVFSEPESAASNDAP